MIKSMCILAISMSALLITCAMVVVTAQPAAAQTARNLKCKGCVSGKDIKNKTIRTKDIGNNAITSAKITDGGVTDTDLAAGAVTSDTLAAGAVTLEKLGGDVVAVGLTGVVSVPAPAFRDDNVNDNCSWEGGFAMRSTGMGPCCVVAPVSLPDGVVVTRLEGSLLDNSGVDFSVALRRVRIGQGVINLSDLVNLQTSGSETTFQKLSNDNIFDSSPVDVASDTYQLLGCLAETSDQHGILALWVHYE